MGFIPERRLDASGTHTDSYACRPCGKKQLEPLTHHLRSIHPTTAEKVPPTYSSSARNNLADRLTIHGIVDWLHVNRATTYHELGGDTLRQGIRVALSQQKDRKNRKVWECVDKRWRLSEAFVTEQPMEESREGDPSTPSALVLSLMEGASTLDADEGIR